jgi:hypothetical protein
MQYKYKTSKGEKSLNYHATRDADSMGEERKGRGAKISHCTVLHVTVTGIRGPLLDIVLQSAVQEERTDMLVQYTLSISNYYLFDFAIHSFYFSRL